MATESLVQYLHNKTGLKHEQLRPIFKMTHEFPSFTEDEKENILDALDKIKILDPACGSGAFPMGVLQKIVMALQKLDPDAIWWTERQVKRIKNQYVRKALREKLEDSSVEYARKIGVIQNSLYGVDIQPIAAEISKLRCFLSLVVDETINENKPNRGIEPLPNLEFKFVTADTLQKLPEKRQQRGLFDNFEELQKLEELRIEYLQSFGKKKEKIKDQYIKVQAKMFKNELHLFTDTNSRAYKLSSWNPFSHEKADWFDPKWMYGVDNFDVVIGNPPYVLLQNTSLSIKQQKSLRKSYFSAQYKTDLFHLFFERGLYCLEKEDGILCYITPNTFLKNKHNDQLRKLILENSHLIELIRFYVPIFENASVDNSITIFKRDSKILDQVIQVKDIYDNKFKELFNPPTLSVNQKSLMHDTYSFDFDLIGNNILYHISKNPLLGEYGRAYFGIQTFDRKSFVSDSKIDENYQYVVDGVHVNRYKLNKSKEYVKFTHDAIKSGGNSEVYKKERILVRQIGRFPEGCYCPPNVYTLNTIYNIFLHENAEIELLYLLGIINSKVINYYWINIFSDSKKTFPKIKKAPLESIPIVKVSNKEQELIVLLVNYILFINSIENSKSINPHVPNSHLVQLFEEVIDAMVMELYFEEEFKKAGIEFIKYAERDFKPIEHLKTEEEKIEAIHEAYQKLRQKDNEIRNNLKLMDIKLADIVMPIKTVR